MTTMTDRKAMRRAYEEQPRPMGIWRVTNATNGRALVGASVDVPAMLNRIRAQLRFGGHRNADLQRDWNTLGEPSFTFETLDLLKPRDEPGYDPTDDLAALEAMWLEQLQPYAPAGYNARPRR